MLKQESLEKDLLVSGNKAMKIMGLSKHSFEKIVKDKIISTVYENGKKYYKLNEIEEIANNEKYIEI